MPLPHAASEAIRNAKKGKPSEKAMVMPQRAPRLASVAKMHDHATTHEKESCEKRKVAYSERLSIESSRCVCRRTVVGGVAQPERSEERATRLRHAKEKSDDASAHRRREKVKSKTVVRPKRKLSPFGSLRSRVVRERPPRCLFTRDLVGLRKSEALLSPQIIPEVRKITLFFLTLLGF